MGVKTDLLKFICTQKGLNYVSGRGNPRSPIWIIGEAPGADEDAAGIAFVGYSGRQLDGQIAEAGLSSSDIYFTNPYKVRPPENEIERRWELGIPDNLYLDAFWEELNEFKPPFIVSAGATPTSILCPFTVSRRDQTPRISAWRGSLLCDNRLGWDHFVVPMYHPAFILREYSERSIAVFCLERVREEFDYYRANANRLQPLPERSLIYDPSFDDCFAYLSDCLESKYPISHDIENPYYKKIHLPYVMNFSISSKSAISFNLWDFPEGQLLKLWRLIDEVLRKSKLIGQNYVNYDAPYMRQSCGLQPNVSQLDDTMTRHKILWPEFEHALQFQTIQYTREPYYKDEGHDFDTNVAAGDRKRSLRKYGCKDSAVTYEIWEKQEHELDQRGLRQFYERIEMPLARNFYEISGRGILVDERRLRSTSPGDPVSLRTRLIKELNAICRDTEKIIGRPVFFDGESCKDFQRAAKAASGGTIKRQSDTSVFNLGSPKQVGEEFERRGIWLPYDNKGKPKTDEEALQKSLAKTGNRLPKLILESRGLNKLKGTNIDVNLKSKTLFSNIITTGTVNGRRSSGMFWNDTPFVYGTNLQNLPKHGEGIVGAFQNEFRECLIARPGKIFLACDQVQAEDWIVQGIIADQSGDRRGLEELLNNVDRHRKLASRIFNKPESECGKGTHERFLGKKTRHAGNYDMQAFRFAVELAKEGFHVSEDYCQILLNAFHDFDPGIRGVFHKYIKSTLENCRTLINPFGRVRVFFGLHPSRDNTKVFKEAYSMLPQSTVSDNTAQAVNYVEANAPGLLVKEDHDAVTLEIDNNLNSILYGMDLLDRAFNRKVVLEKGLSFQIPIEHEIGYNLRTMKLVTQATLGDVYDSLQPKAAKPEILEVCPV